MHTFTKQVTFTPLSKGRYRCNQTGRVMTQKQILGHVSAFMATGRDTVIGVTMPQKSGTAPKRAKGEKHPSKYRTKHR